MSHTQLMNRPEPGAPDHAANPRLFGRAVMALDGSSYPLLIRSNAANRAALDSHGFQRPFFAGSALQRAIGNQATRRLVQQSPAGLIQRRALTLPDITDTIIQGDGDVARRAANKVKRLMRLAFKGMSTAQQLRLDEQFLETVGAFVDTSLTSFSREDARGFNADELSHLKTLVTLMQDVTKGEAGETSAEVFYPGLADYQPPQTEAQRNALSSIVNATAETMTNIASSRPQQLQQVFGTNEKDLNHAATVFAEAALALRALLQADQIHLDTRGDAPIFGWGALTRPGYMLIGMHLLEDSSESRSKFAHESTHALTNASLKTEDHVYPQAEAAFQGASAAIKLSNAAHYEVVFKHFVDGTDAPECRPSESAGAQLGDAAQKVKNDATKRVKTAWIVSINVHKSLLDLARQMQTTSTLPQDKTSKVLHSRRALG